ncbi:hypothetical protein LOTGIDRAFT_184022 [Lottia gigantea]|uniref:GSKIP domain-containing protein n=1 Tax=Lottia gigantea TaxID=225164 RepID=V3Z0I3_LOTGI|nr:hypothetical protein LOTGIDRAFT_184022 [Lottia gigantea]ESO83978.1 hypothetical protein LOTGIDRAFT_184022 [Lottia gigantea]
MNIDEDSRDATESCQPLKIEANEAVKEVAFAVKSVEISSKIPPKEDEVFLNLCTLEGETYCVELSLQGFRIVGSEYDTIDQNINCRHFETIYSLLDSVSPNYRQTFGDALMKKLSMLEGDGGDEPMSQD